jgi:polar amino acid transport system substrate-binding protein
MSLLLILASHVAFAKTTSSPNTITVGTDDYCPFSCLIDNKPAGIQLVAMESILTKHGYELKAIPLGIERSASLSKQKSLDFVSAVSEFDAEALGMEINKVPFGALRVFFYTHIDQKFEYRDVSSLKNRKLGIIQGYGLTEPLDKYVADKNNAPNIVILKGEKPNERLIRMLESRRLDTVPMTAAVFWYLYKTLKLKGQYQVAGELGLEIPPNRTGIYIGTKHGDDPRIKHVMKLIDTGLTDMKKNGELEKIAAKYGVTMSMIDFRPPS